jgi:hypothetical protein
MKDRWRARVGAAALLAVAAPGAQAASVLALTGYDASSDSAYAYVAGVLQFPHPSSPWVPLVRVWANYLRYRYESGGTDITARADGARFSIGCSYIREGGYTTVTVGVANSDTRIPAGFSSSVQGSRTGAFFDIADVHALSERWKTDGIASYSTGDRGYWSRARLLVRPGGSVYIGPEASFQGSPDYTEYRLGGAVTEIPLGAHASAQLSGGYQKIRDVAGAAYGSIGLAVSF